MSETSQSAAVVSSLAALLLQAQQGLFSQLDLAIEQPIFNFLTSMLIRVVANSRTM